MSGFLPRDFVETAEGLLFAVVDGRPEDGKVLAWLRYAEAGKLSSAQAEALLRQRHPQYLHYSARLDARLHAVPVAQIRCHHRPRERLRALLAQGPRDDVEQKLLRLAALLAQGGVPLAAVGVPGSVLVGRQRPGSDLDLVVYRREAFFRARSWVRALAEAGRLDELDADAWREAYARRGCALDFAEFLRHERRKGNKGMVAGTKFDLALIAEDEAPEPAAVWRKTGRAVVRARVLDDARAYDQPARYRIDHAAIGEILSFTHTYAGQAVAGERVEAAGAVEACDDGRKRLVVGSSREAPGEFIRVLAACDD